MPSYVESFLKNTKIKVDKNSYIFYITTYGTTTGQADYFIKKLLNKQNINLNASYSIKTVDNWTVEFNVNDSKLIEDILHKEALQIKDVISSIKNEEKVFIHKDKKSLFMCKSARFFYNLARRTKHLNVSNQCINCGLCANNCPVDAIKIIDDKPKWVIDKCVMCFRCLHNCPKFAIQYDDKTNKNGQYIHPKK